MTRNRQKDLDSATLDMPVPGVSGLARVEQSEARLGRAAIRRRARVIAKHLSRERWLPIGLRTLYAEEIARMSAELDNDDCDWERTAVTIRELAWASYVYGDAVSRSRTVEEIRVLDLELDGYLSARWRLPRRPATSLSEQN